MTRKEFLMKDSYKFMGHIYDLLGDLYSGKQITYCKQAMVDRINPGDNVLFAGVGHGKDATQAARKDARVTVVDLSETMLEKFTKGIAPYTFKYPVKQIHDNIFNVAADEKYDFVFANFFLNF